MLVENQAVGHTTVSQSSACTINIVANYLLNSQVGRCGFYSPALLTERDLLQLPQQDTKCAVDSNDFFPDVVASARRSLRRK